MARYDTYNSKLAIAESYRRRAEELELRALEAEAFGSERDYPIESVILFKRTFISLGPKRPYTYVAVKYTDSYWAITGTAELRLSFDQLVEKHLVPAKNETGEVWLVTKYELL